VAFAVQFVGVFGGYAVAAQTAVLLAFVVAVSIPAPASDAWARVAGWTLAGGIAIAASLLLWPRHARTQVRQRAADACRALAALLADPGSPVVRDRASERIEATRRAYDQAPLRPAGPRDGTEPWSTWCCSSIGRTGSPAASPARATRGPFPRNEPCAGRPASCWRRAQSSWRAGRPGRSWSPSMRIE